MSDNATPAKPLPTPQTHPLIFRLAREVGSPISFFDLETTGLGHSQPTFGITEFAFLAILPDGRTHAHAKLLNPENRIEDKASEVTGITQDMVKDAPNVGQHADTILRMISKTLMVGFNSDSYDLPALFGQLDRYGVARPAAWKSVDLYNVWRDVQNRTGGKQTVVAEHYGVPFEGAHRALADCSALADIMEQMLWHHGMQPIHKALRHNWDGVARDAEGKPIPKAERSSRPAASGSKAPVELTEGQLALKAAIDASLASTPSTAQFTADLAAAGFEMVSDKWKNIAYLRGKGTPQSERTSGGALGKGYSWPDVKSRLSDGAAPAAEPSSSKPTYDRGAEAAAAKAAIAELAKEPGRIDLALAAQKSGASAKTVSFAISEMLSEGSVSPDQAKDPVAQAWLDQHWEQLPTQGRLTPLLDQCKVKGAPAEIDFTQLRVALATRKSMGATSQAQRPAPASRPQQKGSSVPFRSAAQPAAAAVAPAGPDFDAGCPFDEDMPPPPPFEMDEGPSAHRMGP